jgi:hypothetical protein
MYEMGERIRTRVLHFTLLKIVARNTFRGKGLAGKEREFSRNFSEKKRLVLIAV